MVLSIGVALKWLDLRPSVNPLTGVVSTDTRSCGCSPADEAALEWALRMAEAWGAGGAAEVVAATVGPEEAGAALRLALEAGACRAVRVPAPEGAGSEEVARALASPAVLGGCAVVICGDWSLDRGSGSVPAFLAAWMGASQALGLVGLSFQMERPGELRAERRLDGGRREHLALRAPAVVSVEGATARLRRAALPAVLSAREAGIEVVGEAGPAAGAAGREWVVEAWRKGPLRPRAKVLPGPDPALPARLRVAALVEGGPGGQRGGPGEVVEAADAGEAAEAVLEALRRWGELGDG